MIATHSQRAPSRGIAWISAAKRFTNRADHAITAGCTSRCGRRFFSRCLGLHCLRIFDLRVFIITRGLGRIDVQKLFGCFSAEKLVVSFRQRSSQSGKRSKLYKR